MIHMNIDALFLIHCFKENIKYTKDIDGFYIVNERDYWNSICGLYNHNNLAINSLHFSEDGEYCAEDVKVTCPKCIEVLKMNGY